MIDHRREGNHEIPTVKRPEVASRSRTFCAVIRSSRTSLNLREVNAYVQGYQPREEVFQAAGSPLLVTRPLFATIASFEDTLFTQGEGAVVVHKISARTKICYAGTA